MTAQDLVSLPKGGGAQSGLGEQFGTDTFKGTGNYTVPLTVPPGRSGFQPDLALSYSTGQGNGPFGLGWDLGTPVIRRKTARGVPTYDDLGDTFVLSGAEDLVPVAGDLPGTRIYRPRTEGLFARIAFTREGTTRSWSVSSKDGRISHFGAPEPGVAVTANPAEPSQIFAWHLRETVDPLGNRIVYDYETDIDAALGQGTQTYLRRIRYAENQVDAGGGFFIEVRFDYTSRPDPVRTGRAGFFLNTRLRCQSITMLTASGPGGAMAPVRRFDLRFVDDLVRDGDAPADRLPANGASLLAQVRAVGIDAQGVEERLPALDFGYTDFQPARRRFHPLRGSALPVTSLSDAKLDLVDLTGNGLPDFLETDGRFRWWENLGGGRFSHPRSMARAPSGASLASPVVSALDINGDGRTELVVTGPGAPGYYSVGADGTFDSARFHRLHATPSFDMTDPSVAFFDLDGDGAMDAVRSGARFDCFFREADGGWSRHVQRPRGVPGSFPDVTFGDPRVRTGDMTGDGLSDIVTINGRRVAYWPNLGHGNWGTRIDMRRAPDLPPGYHPRQVLLGDLDGDGSQDLVFIGDRSIRVWFNQGGTGWSDPVEIRGTPPFYDSSDIRIVDLNGSGTSGILWSDATGPGGRARWHFLDLSGGVKPYLLDRIDNNMGAITALSYRSSVDDFLRDRARAETRWRTTLPMPVQVVGEVAVTDVFSGNRLVTSFSYRHGAYDGVEKAFIGFGSVTEHVAELDLGDNASPFEGLEVHLRGSPTETRHWFALGPTGAVAEDWSVEGFDDEYWSGDPSGFPLFRDRVEDRINSLSSRDDRRDAWRALRGTPLRTEVYARDGSARQDRPYTVTETLRDIDVVQLAEPADTWSVFFAFDLATRTTSWERGNDPMTRIELSGDPDAFGQPRRQMTLGCPRGWAGFGEAREDFLTHGSVTQFATRVDDTHLIVDRPAQVDTVEIFSTIEGVAVTAENLAQAFLDGIAETRLLARARSYYDGAAFVGLPLQQIGDFGLLVRQEELALTGDDLAAALDGAFDPALPPYLDPAAPGGADYPAGFVTATHPSAGYRIEDADGVAHYYAEVAANRYDVQDGAVGTSSGLVTATRDGFGAVTEIAHDAAGLFPVHVTGPTGLTVDFVHDYTVMQPARVEDANGNVTLYRFTPLGLLDAVVKRGPDGIAEGDTEDAPSERFEYDLLAFEGSAEEAFRRPASSTAIRRQFHRNGPVSGGADPDATVRRVEFSDGFGRILQAREQAESLADGDDAFGVDPGLPRDMNQAPTDAVLQAIPGRVRVSGAVVYDAQGREVEQYEPYFDVGFDYVAPRVAQTGQRARTFYDPAGRAVRNRFADGSETWTIHGVPADLSVPADFDPSPWEIYGYDQNDLAPLSTATGDGSGMSARAPASHAFTPKSTLIDALGRDVIRIERLGPMPDDRLITSLRYDIQGNLLEIIDPMGRPAFRYLYDRRNRLIRTDAIDAGQSLAFQDASDRDVEMRDGKGAVQLTTHDTLSRLRRIWHRDRDGLPFVAREHVFYGEDLDGSLTRVELQARNLLGRVALHYDGAGLARMMRYDFRGRPVQTEREVPTEAVLSMLMDAGLGLAQMDWPAEGLGALAVLASERHDPRVLRVDTLYDALDRAIRVDHPETVTGARARVHFFYNEAGSLVRLVQDDAPYIQHITYDAAGQRTLVANGNGVMTRYAYDPVTRRVARMHSARFDQIGDRVFQTAGPPLQDLGYTYDLVGNITRIEDRTDGSGILNNPDAAVETGALAMRLASGDAMIRRFEYDALYRLVSATGREHDGPAGLEPWRDTNNPTDVTRARAYAERYRYSRTGTLEEMRHQAGAAGSFTRLFTAERVAGEDRNNRLARLSVAGQNFDYSYDAMGNLIDAEASRRHHWDARNQMKGFEVGPSGAAPSIEALYLYGADGARLVKLVRRSAGPLRMVVTAGGFERTREGQVENDVLDIMDGASRLASLRFGPAFPDDTTPAAKHYLSDHQNSVTVVLDSAGGLIDREEFRAYGETAFGSVARKRWRYTGQHRDAESGLQHHGARYYAPWLCRWVTPDPAGPVDGPNLYRYCAGNPLNFSDPSGLAAGDPSKKWWGGLLRGFGAGIKLLGTVPGSITPGIEPPPIQQPDGPAGITEKDAIPKTEKRKRVTDPMDPAPPPPPEPPVKPKVPPPPATRDTLITDPTPNPSKISDVPKGDSFIGYTVPPPPKVGPPKSLRRKVLNSAKRIGPLGIAVGIVMVSTNAYAGDYEGATKEAVAAVNPAQEAIDIAETAVAMHEYNVEVGVDERMVSTGQSVQDALSSTLEDVPGGQGAAAVAGGYVTVVSAWYHVPKATVEMQIDNAKDLGAAGIEAARAVIDWF